MLVRRFLSEEKGVALVESAIALPIFFLILFGIIDFCWILNQHIALSELLVKAGRIGALQTTDCLDTAIDNFHLSLTNYGLENVNPLYSSSIENDDGVFKFSVQANISCIFCDYYPSGTVAFNKTLFTPLEQPDLCVP